MNKKILLFRSLCTTLEWMAQDNLEGSLRGLLKLSSSLNNSALTGFLLSPGLDVGIRSGPEADDDHGDENGSTDVSNGLPVFPDDRLTFGTGLHADQEKSKKMSGSKFNNFQIGRLDQGA